MKLRLLLPLALLLAGVAQAQDAARVYHYWMPLDVRKVLDMSEQKTELCQVVRATMVYLDSAGRKQTLYYRKLSERCSYES